MHPDPERVDVLCIGVVARDVDGGWHVNVLPSPDKLRAVAGSVPADRLVRLAVNLRDLLSDCLGFSDAQSMLRRTRSAVQLHDFEGEFAYADDVDFGQQVQAIMRESVIAPRADAPVAVRAPSRPVRPRTRARLRQHFQTIGILARKADEISDHKVVHNYPVSLKHGLTAEFAVKNGVMHITETVDFEVADDAVRNKRFEAQAKCLVMQHARTEFGAQTRCYVVVSGGSVAHAARSVDLLSTAGQLYAVESDEDMRAYFAAIEAAAGVGSLDAAPLRAS